MALESTVLDQFGNPFSGTLDVVGDELVTEAGRDYSKNLAAVNAEVMLEINGAATATFDVRSGAANLSFVFEGSLDGVNYDIPLQAWATRSLVGATISAETYVNTVVVATTIAATYTAGVTGLRRARLRISARTSGDIDVAARASRADLVIYARFIPSVLWVTNTGAANAAVTLTIPAAGAGLFHYITGVWLGRAGAAALAGTAVLVITTTNWPGSAAFSVGNASPAGGTQRDVELVPSNPIKSLLANTATTIVMPAPGAGVLWRANVSYYVGA